MEDALVVSLESIVMLDPTLASLPLGWYATLKSLTEAWTRAPEHLTSDD